MWIKEFSNLLYPPVSLCPICQVRSKSRDLPGCLDCLLSLGLTYRPLKTGFPAYALATYDGRIKELLNQIKYQNDYQLAVTFGQLMGLAVRELAIMQKVDYLLPVPLHFSRQRKRGFNQALAFAEGIVKVWRRPIFNKVFRVKDTLPQSGLSPSERRRNLNNAFVISKAEHARAKHLLVIDDIFTTGITFSSLANLICKYQGHPMGLFLAQSVGNV